jgi:hypothetical protein
LVLLNLQSIHFFLNIPTSVEDPNLESGAFLTPWSGMGKNRIRIRDEQPGSYFWDFRNPFFGLKYLNYLMQIRDPGSGMGKIRVRDPGWKTFGSGIRDKHPWSATLIPSTVGKECCSCRVRYQREGLTGLEEELRMELIRISQRNLGRDNRMVGN